MSAASNAVCHAGAIEDAGAQQLGEAAAGAVLHDVGQQAEVLVDVGVAGAGREMQRAGAGDDAGGLGVAERRLGRRAVQHRHRPVVAQAGLVVAQVQRGGRRLLDRCGRRARTSASSTDGSGKASSTTAQVNCLVMEHMRNSVRGVNGMRRSALAQPQVWRSSTSPSRSDGDGAAGSGIGAGECCRRCDRGEWRGRWTWGGTVAAIWSGSQAYG